jgi:hypothetical protein
MDRKTRIDCMVPSFSWSFAFKRSVLDYVKDQVYSQSVNMVDELKAWITAAIANVSEYMLECIWQEADYKCGVCRAVDGVHCEVFYT